MAALRRIILIHTHLPGVVELLLDGHTNICGTNASGKTTLQRLIPVFYGELPSKVVPKTRSKFDEFYLPCENSYLIYEYQREDGEICQVVLTSKMADGVQYRFVDAPYNKEQILTQDEQGKVYALSNELWLKQLKQLGLKSSHKISSTSEYRAIIQNDVGAIRSVVGGNKEAIKIRQLAARYALVSSRHKIRHIEKLVSAVHAKEGKMDTLKTMLAAIFEEDGLVQPTTRVKNAKAREWIKQMRQSMRLAGLQTYQQNLNEVADKLTHVESQLFQLRPLLSQNLQLSITEKADTEAKINQLRRALSELKQSFNEQENALNSRLSESKSELATTSANLDHIQDKYDHYQQGDIEQLSKDFAALALWREALAEQEQQYQILLDQYGDLEKQLNQQKLILNESLERLNIKNRKKIKEIELHREQKRGEQEHKKEALTSQYQARKDELTTSFETNLQTLQQNVITEQAQLSHLAPTPQEQESLQLADKRLDSAQDKWRSASQEKSQSEQSLQQKRVLQEQAQNSLEQARQQQHQCKLNLQQLERQLTPQQGSLRHFLREHVEGWEHTLGKVIDEPLLDRNDLNPQFTRQSDEQLFGLTLALNVIELPDYAQDETALKINIEQAVNHLSQASKAQIQAEKLLTQHHQAVIEQQALLQKCHQVLETIDQEIEFARESKNRLLQEQKHALASRKKEAEQQLKIHQKQYDQGCSEKQQALETLHSDHQEQLLEFKSDWQQEIDLLTEDITELEKQVDSKRASNKEQIQQLEQAFNQELAHKEIDPNTLKNLQQSIKTHKENIAHVSGRQDELNVYRKFIEIEWQKQRPTLLETETQLKAQTQAISLQLNQQRTQYKNEQQQIEARKNAQADSLQALENLLIALNPLVNKLNELTLFITGIETAELNQSANNVQIENEQTVKIQGELHEWISRAKQDLEKRSKLDREVKDQLNSFESVLTKDAQGQFLDIMNSEFSRLAPDADSREKLPIFKGLLQILTDQQRQILEQGETIGGDLHKFFTVFSDINRRISGQSKRLTQAVADDLTLDGINRSEVRIISTVDELGFWQPLKRFAGLFEAWRLSGKQLPSDDYIDALADVVELLRADASYSIESLLRLELHLNEGGNDLVIRNDRQLLESSSHGMAYLILCKFLLAFTRLLRGQARITINWPIDEIGTLAYHNVEKLFAACDDNHIHIVGAFPNPESEVLTLFKHRYLIDKQKKKLQRIEPKLNRITERLQQVQLQHSDNNVNPKEH